MREPETFRTLLRDAADPDLAPGAAQRIADGAWERAQRASAASRSTSLRAPRRLVVPAVAAASILVALTLAVRGSAPAFAVDGDPVQVLRSDTWESARRVPVGSWVFVPQGANATVRGSDGSLVAPRPGALFRIVASHVRARSWRVELRSGGAEVAGSRVDLAFTGALEVARDDESQPLRVTVTSGSTLDSAPERVEGIVASSPAVRVLDGTARVADLRATDFLVLRASEGAGSFDVGRPGAPAFRVLREVAWTPDVAMHVFRGANVVAAAPRGEGGVSVALMEPGAGARAFFIASPLRDEAISMLNLATTQRAAFEFETRVVRTERAASPDTASYECVQDGRRTAITIRGDGSARLERTGEPPRDFVSLAALRRDAPDAAALFGDKLR